MGKESFSFGLVKVNLDLGRDWDTSVDPVIKVNHCLESLEEEIKYDSFDFYNISLFFDKFEYALVRISTIDEPDKSEYFYFGMKQIVVQFFKKILCPLYSGQKKLGLLNFLKSGNLKLIHFVLKLLNA